MTAQVAQLASRTRGAAESVSPRASALLRAVAAQLESHADAIARSMVHAYEAEIPAYRAIADASLISDIHSVSAAMVRCWLTVMASGRPVDDELLEPLTEGARRRAAQGIPLESMLRAYRIGVRVMWSEITASPACRGRALQEVMAPVATWVLDFADRITTAVAAAYTDEAAHVAREREHRRSGLLNVILAGPGPEQRRGPDELAAPHCVVVAKLPSNLSLEALEEVGRQLEDRADALLWTVRHCSVVAAVGTAGDVGREQLHQRLARLTHDGRVLALGVGDRAEGPAESRQSYAEASDALQVGPHVTHNPQPVYDYRDLAPVIALLAEPARARRFAVTALEPLASVIDRKWVLPTVEAYLSRQGRLKEVAAALGVHQNTVKYRINELRPFLDTTIGDGDRAAALLLAVRVRQYLAAQSALP